MVVGILALQGGFAEHCAALEDLGIPWRLVRTAPQLDGVHGLILPGGESTTFGILAQKSGLLAPLREFAQQRPVWGVCAGLVFLAQDVGRPQTSLGVLSLRVARNAYGRQRESFQAEVQVQDVGAFPGVFIRAPRILSWGPEVEPWAWCGEEVVAVRHGHLWATAFHPELTSDRRIHARFAALCRERSMLPPGDRQCRYS
jgi:5'-phosphate synthase pdxT subunit